MNACPFCQNENICQIENLRFELFICPDCHSTFLETKSMAALTRDLFRPTRKSWLDVLGKSPVQASLPEDSNKLCCIHHGKALEKKRIPDYGHDGYQASCCALLHLMPEEIREVLEISLPTVSTLNTRHSSANKGGLVRAFGKPLFALLNLFSSGNELDDTELESIQFERKFRKVLSKRTNL